MPQDKLTIEPSGFFTQTSEEIRIPEHFHTTDKVDARDLLNKRGTLVMVIAGTAAATATNYGVIFIAPWSCAVTEIRESHQTAGTDGGAVSLNIEKLTGTQALDGGTNMLSTAFDLKASINTVRTGTLTTVGSTLQLVRGDRLALADSGTLTAVAGVTVTIDLKQQ